MAKITYMPTPSDPDETAVSGIAFKAYEETVVDDPALVEKLKGNSWFTEDTVDEARHATWSKVRAAQAKLKESSEEAASLGVTLP